MSVKTVSTVAIAGITGKLGRLIAESILASSQAQVRGFCRDRAKVPVELQSNPRVAIVEGSAEDSKAAREAVRDSDVVVCAYLGPNDFMVNSQEVLIDAAETEKVPRYIASDWALDYTKLKLGDLPPKDPMIQIHDYLGTKDIKPVHILNGAFTPFLVMSLSRDPVEYWGTGDEKWDLTSYETCAQYTAAIALDPSASGILKVRGDLVSIKEIVQLSEKLTGKVHTMKKAGTLEDLRHVIDAAREKGMTGWPTVALFYIYWMNSGKTALGDDLVNWRYPSVKPEKMEEFMSRG